MLESFIQKKLVKWFQKHGWMVIRLRATHPPSMPDLMVLRKGKMKFVEVKQPGKDPTELQQRMIDKLKDEGFEVLVMDAVPEEKKLSWDDHYPNLSSSAKKIT